MKVIGITGGVGAGKSSVLGWIKELVNCEIIFADSLAAGLQKHGERCFAPLTELLGDEIVGEDGEIDRRKMSEIVFNNDELLAKVNAIVHPAVREYIEERIELLKKSEEVDYLFIEAALLIECGYKDIVDEMWYIYASEDVRRDRLKSSRGYSDSKIDSILDNQLSDEEFRNNCDVIIDNSFSDEATIEQVKKQLTKNREIEE